jgi:antitoxin component of RelBE/YafQ-DinJ toxin-antitoxin module
MKPQEKTISTTVDLETFEEIKQACKNCNISISEFLRILVKNQRSDLYKATIKMKGGKS